MASPFRGTGDRGPVHPGVHFGGSVTAGGFVSGSFGERRGRAAVDADGAIRAGDAADPQTGVTAQRQAAGGNVSRRPNQHPGSDRFSAPEPEQDHLR